MNRGQFSIEFITVFGVLLTILAMVSIPLYNDSRESVEKMKNMTLAKEAANKIAYSINTAYIEGLGAKKTVNYTLPKGVDNIKISGSTSSENYVDLLILSNRWGEDNVISVDTLLYKDKPPAVVFENRENIMSPGKHKARVTCELSPGLRIRIMEV